MASPADIHREFLEAFNRRDFEKIRSLFHPQYTYTGGDGQEMTGGPDVGVGIVQMWASAFPDARLAIRRVYELGDVSIGEFSYSGTQTGEFMGIAPTGKRAQGIVCNVLEHRDGKVYREREYMDAMHLLSQLGVTQIPAGVTAS